MWLRGAERVGRGLVLGLVHKRPLKLGSTFRRRWRPFQLTFVGKEIFTSFALGIRNSGIEAETEIELKVSKSEAVSEKKRRCDPPFLGRSNPNHMEGQQRFLNLR